MKRKQRHQEQFVQWKKTVSGGGDKEGAGTWGNGEMPGGRKRPGKPGG